MRTRRQLIARPRVAAGRRATARLFCDKRCRMNRMPAERFEGLLAARKGDDLHVGGDLRPIWRCQIKLGLGGLV